MEDLCHSACRSPPRPPIHPSALPVPCVLDTARGAGCVLLHPHQGILGTAVVVVPGMRARGRVVLCECWWQALGRPRSSLI